MLKKWFTMYKEKLRADYIKMWSAKTDKQILKEINDYNKYFNKTSGSWSNGQSNPSDFTPSDKLLELKIIARERNIL